MSFFKLLRLRRDVLFSIAGRLVSFLWGIPVGKLKKISNKMKKETKLAFMGLLAKWMWACKCQKFAKRLTQEFAKGLTYQTKEVNERILAPGRITWPKEVRLAVINAGISVLRPETSEEVLATIQKGVVKAEDLYPILKQWTFSEEEVKRIEVNDNNYNYILSLVKVSPYTFQNAWEKIIFSPNWKVLVDKGIERSDEYILTRCISLAKDKPHSKDCKEVVNAAVGALLEMGRETAKYLLTENIPQELSDKALRLFNSLPDKTSWLQLMVNRTIPGSDQTHESWVKLACDYVDYDKRIYVALVNLLKRMREAKVGDADNLCDCLVNSEWLDEKVVHYLKREKYLVKAFCLKPDLAKNLFPFNGWDTESTKQALKCMALSGDLEMEHLLYFSDDIKDFAIKRMEVEAFKAVCLKAVCLNENIEDLKSLVKHSLDPNVEYVLMSAMSSDCTKVRKIVNQYVKEHLTSIGTWAFIDYLGHATIKEIEAAIEGASAVSKEVYDTLGMTKCRYLLKDLKIAE